MAAVQIDYGEGNLEPLYLSMPECAYLHYVEHNETIPENEYHRSLIENFAEAVIVTNNTPKTLVDFNQGTVEELFGSSVGDLPLVGRYNLGSYIQLPQLTSSDYSQGEPCDSVGSLSDLLSSTTLANGSCLRTHNIPMALSIYDPPLTLATDLKAWGDTLDHPYCKRHVTFPRLRTRWGNVTTAGIFTDWISPSNGECTFLNILSGAQYVVIAVPRIDTSHPLTTNPSNDTNNWDFEGALLEEGMKL